MFQRPQHLMLRFAHERRVFFIEEPVLDSSVAELAVRVEQGVHVVVPHLPSHLNRGEQLAAQRLLIKALLSHHRVANPTAWLYTPLALPLLDGLSLQALVYDCMDELSGFAGASAQLPEMELELLSRADVVFTGGHHLYEAKRHAHANVHAFPSSVDVAHFASARQLRGSEPDDQRDIPHPRIGFCGVIDERMNLDLVRELARARSEWHFVMVGPTAKINPADLPQSHNLHYLGLKSYDELPAYFAGWHAAMMPFAHNDATRFISPTKTPEYLAAGCPVVSTSIHDVVHPYGERGMVHIADTVQDFEQALVLAMSQAGRDAIALADPFLATMSWDRTWARMDGLVQRAERESDSKDVSVVTPQRGEVESAARSL